jgi:hypothetical protein
MPESSLVRKLLLKPGYTLLILNAPDGYIQTLNPLPEGVEIHTQVEAHKTFDFVQVFVYNKADVDSYAPTTIQATRTGGLLWLAFPKKSSKIKTDISRDSGWESLNAAGWQGVTLISLDDTWSAFRARPIGESKTRQ